MGEVGLLDPQCRFELIEGEVFRASPRGKPHGLLVAHLSDLLWNLYGQDFYVRVQLPLSLGPHSEPEPDLSLCEKAHTKQALRHPVTAALVIEEADSSLPFDRLRKAVVYAQANIPEYWILNIEDRSVEILRQPVNGRYEESSVRREDEACVPGFAAVGTAATQIYSVL